MRTEAIKALAESGCGLTAKNLESANDELLLELKAAAEAKAELTTKLTAAEAKVTELGAELKAASEKVLTTAELPADVQAIVAEHKAREQAEKDGIIKSLEAAKVLTPEQLAAKPIDELRTLAKFAKVETPDYSGRGVAVLRTENKADFTPPDAYADGIKALRAVK